jgi:small subunit ribosomal protein S8
MSASTDTLGDMLAAIRNGALKRKERVEVPYARLKLEVARALARAGYLRAVNVEEREGKRSLVITLAYRGEEPAFRELKRLSKPGRRLTAGVREIPRVAGGAGVIILTTPRGVLSDREARKQGVGGELICSVW